MESLPEPQGTNDAAKNELESWTAVVPFSVGKPYSVGHCDNILDFLTSAWTDCKFYFPLSKYAADVLGDEYPGWDLLKKDLGTAALDNGTCFVTNGGGGDNSRRFLCDHNACFKRHSSSLQGDRNNTRGEVGQSMF
jgi:hypothetical protein